MLAIDARPQSYPATFSRRTSSTSPAAIIASTRTSMRRYSASRSIRSPITRDSNVGASFLRHALNGRPVALVTSIARMMRRELFGSIVRALSASIWRNSLSSAPAPSRRSRSFSSARSARSGGTRGTRHPSSSAQTYCPVPPTTIGSLPRDQMSASASFARSRNAARVNVSSGAATSTSQWRAAACSAAVGFAVPISMPR